MATSTKKTTTKRSPKSAVKKASVKKTRVASQTHKVDYYPNRMTVAVSALAGTILVLLAIITVLGSR